VLAATTLPINVELKSSWPGAVGALPAAVVAVLAAQPGAATRVVISSFDPAALVAVHALAPHLPLGVLFEREVAVAPTVAGARSLHPPHVRCTAEAVARWRAAGLAVHTWTVDDPARLRALAAAGVDGVFANDPRAAIAAFRGLTA